MMQCEFWPLLSQSLVAPRIVKRENYLHIICMEGVPVKFHRKTRPSTFDYWITCLQNKNNLPTCSYPKKNVTTWDLGIVTEYLAFSPSTKELYLGLVIETYHLYTNPIMRYCPHNNCPKENTLVLLLATGTATRGMDEIIRPRWQVLRSPRAYNFNNKPNNKQSVFV